MDESVVPTRMRAAEDQIEMLITDVSRIKSLLKIDDLDARKPAVAEGPWFCPLRNSACAREKCMLYTDEITHCALREVGHLRDLRNEAIRMRDIFERMYRSFDSIMHSIAKMK